MGVLLGARGADLGSLLADLGSLLGVRFGSWGGMLPAAAENLKNSTPLQPQAPCSQTGCPRLCSLYIVICLCFCDFGYGKTRKSPRIASRDVGSLLAKKGLKLQRGAVFECFWLVF